MSAFEMDRVFATATVVLARPRASPMPASCAAALTKLTAEFSTDLPNAPNMGRV